MISPSAVDIDREKGNFHFDTQYAFDAGVGLSEEVVRYISEIKGEDSPVGERERNKTSEGFRLAQNAISKLHNESQPMRPSVT